MTESKPGDVALIRTEGGEFDVLGLRDTHGWAHLKDWDSPTHAHSCWTTAGKVRAVRPLVVIDPESDGDLNRILDGLEQQGWDTSDRLDCLRAVMREFADPKPPKPDEPTGLGAVIEDSDGIRWTRVETAQTVSRNPWFPAADIDAQPEEYRNITVVRVLSEGIR